MATRFRMRPAHWVALALVLPPVWKAVEWARGSRPKPVSPESVAAGGILFRHVWTPNDSLASGDGLGPVFNASSCVECHHQGGLGGSGPLEKNVTVYGVSDGRDMHGMPPAGVVHRKAIRPEFQETLGMVDPAFPNAPLLPLATILNGGGHIPGVTISQRNTPALFGDGLLDALPAETIIAHQREHSAAARLVGLNGARDGAVQGRVARLVDGRVGRFGWKGEFATLTDFVKAACANELGLSNPGRAQAAPLGQRGYRAPGTDLSDAQCELMTDFVRGLARPVEVLPADSHARTLVEAGRKAFGAIGCADCHSPSLGSVEGIYSDLLLHDMGVELEASPGSYGEPPVPAPEFAKDARPNPAEWRTPPLWGVADSAPYLHDGRAETLERAIELHGGEARQVGARFKELPPEARVGLIAFLKSLRAPSEPLAALARK